MNFDDGILKEHNEQAYVKLMDEIAKNRKACAVHATGTGKMYLALKWLNDHKDEQFAYIAPTNVILNEFLNIIIKQYYPNEFERLKYTNIDKKLDRVNQLLNNKNIHLLTYAKVNSLTSEEKKELHVKRIVLDEFHRCGADKWGEAIREFLDIHSDAEVLGLSATPIRPSDGRNMVDELFDGKQTSTITLEDAFENDILTIPYVICAIYSFGEELDKIRNKFIDKTLSEENHQFIHDNLKKAKKLIEQARGIKEIFSAGLAKLDNPSSGKFIVFCSSIEDMKKKMEEAKNWFDSDKKISMYSVNYTKGDIANTKTIATFEDDQSDSIKLLFSVDMLNEGLHVKDVDGVIMLRPTESKTVFSQQLGRALNVCDNSNKAPLVFDLVNNIEILDNDVSKFNEIVLHHRQNTDSSIDYDEHIDFKIQKDIIDIVKKLKEFTLTFADRFSPLVDYYKNIGSLANIKTDDHYEYHGKDIRIGNIIRLLRVQYDARSTPISNGKGGYIRPLTNEEVKILEDMGMIWSAIKTFDERIAPLVDYYHKHGTIANIKKNESYLYNDKEVKIGSLIGDLRREYYARNGNNPKNPLSDEEVELLEKMGMVWNVDKRDFMLRIAPLIDYYHKHGTIANIKMNESYFYNDKKVKIGILVGDLRKNYFARETKNSSNFPLTDEEVKILEDMGMIWSAIKTFDERIAPLVDYYHKYGSLANISSKDTYVYNGEKVNIGILISQLRRAYQKRTNKDCKSRGHALTDEEVKILEDMGMVWSAIKTFDERIAPLVDYYHKYGTLANISSKDTYVYNGEEVNIGTLISNLRTAYQGRTNEDCRYLISDEQIKMLEDMGMVWSKPKGRQ